MAGYKIDIIMFFRFLKLHLYLVPSDSDFEKIDISDIDINTLKNINLNHLYSFLEFTEKYRNNGNLTRARKVAALKSFFKYICSKKKIIKENPATDLEVPKRGKRNPIYLSLEESKLLLNSISGRNKERDFCIITLFLNCGVRLSELCDIKIENIRDDLLIIRGKGDKERTIYLNESSLSAIEAYENVRNNKIGIIDKEYLFLSERKKRIDKRTVQTIVKKCIAKAGLDDKKYTTHKLRHTAATLLYKYGNVDIRSLQEILGHESISTTTIYTHVDQETLRKAVKSNPLNN